MEGVEGVEPGFRLNELPMARPGFCLFSCSLALLLLPSHLSILIKYRS